MELFLKTEINVKVLKCDELELIKWCSTALTVSFQALVWMPVSRHCVMVACHWSRPQTSSIHWWMIPTWWLELRTKQDTTLNIYETDFFFVIPYKLLVKLGLCLMTLLNELVVIDNMWWRKVLRYLPNFWKKCQPGELTGKSVDAKYHSLASLTMCNFFARFVQGKIACANVLSDLYAMGVTECDNMLMLLAVSQKMVEKERDIVVPLMIRGFKVGIDFSSTCPVFGLLWVLICVIYYKTDTVQSTFRTWLRMQELVWMGVRLSPTPGWPLVEWPPQCASPMSSSCKTKLCDLLLNNIALICIIHGLKWNANVNILPEMLSILAVASRWIFGIHERM